MAAQRFLSDNDRVRSLVGLALMLLGVAFIVRLAFGFTTLPGITDSYVIPAVILLTGIGLLALGSRFSFVPKTALEVDVEARRYVVLKHGKEQHAGPLDELGPLMLWDRRRKIDKNSHVTEYFVVPSGHSTIDIYCGTNESEIRRKMESLAKAWGLPSKSRGGDVRKPDELDVPLHERLRYDPTATERMELPSTSPVRIDVLPDGYALTSTARDSSSTVIGFVILGVGLSPFLAASPLARWSNFAALDLPQRTLSVLLAGLALVAAMIAALHFRDASRPHSVSITADGIRYGGRRMRFSEIEEVTKNPIQIIGDRRAIGLSASFCPETERTAVAHELIRLIIEVGSRT